jgi:hypothetical protein
LRDEGFRGAAEHPVESAGQCACSRLLSPDRGSEPVRATLLFVIDVSLVLQDPEEGEHRIVGEVDTLVRQRLAHLRRG